MSAAAGSSGKQPTVNFMSNIASRLVGKPKGERKSTGRSRARPETLPRSFGMNKQAQSEHGERPKPGEGARRNGESAPEHASLGARTRTANEGEDYGEQRGHEEHGEEQGREEEEELIRAKEETRLAPKATVGYKGTAEKPETESPNSALNPGKLTDIELGFPAVYIINYWKQKEEKKFAARMAEMQEPPLDYAPHRRYMVDWISEVGEQLDLQTVTIHSAVSFLDELMILMNYSHRDWRLCAVCCLSVAAKYEEAECNMPMISELADATEMSLNTPIVTKGELELVQRLQWDVSRVTAMHFLGYYTSRGVTMPEDTCQGRRLVDKVVIYMKKYVDFFANLCQQDYQFQRYRPSHIAAAAILAARRALCIMPVWRDELTEMTGYTKADIMECGEELWKFYEKMFPTHKPLRTGTSNASAASALRKAEQAAAAAATAPARGGDSRAVVSSSSRSSRGASVDPTRTAIPSSSSEYGLSEARTVADYGS